MVSARGLRRLLALVAVVAAVGVLSGAYRTHYTRGTYGAKGGAYSPRCKLVPNKAWTFTAPTLTWASVVVSDGEPAIVTYAATTNTDAAGVQFKLAGASDYISVRTAPGTAHAATDTITDANDIDSVVLWFWRYNDGAGHVGDWVALDATGPADVIRVPLTNDGPFEREQYPAPVFCAAVNGGVVYSGGKVTISGIGLTGASVGTMTWKMQTHPAHTQIGTNKTAGPGNPVSTAVGISTTAGTVVDLLYTCSTTTPGYKNVTGWTLLLEGWAVSTDGINISPATPTQ